MQALAYPNTHCIVYCLFGMYCVNNKDVVNKLLCLVICIVHS